MDWLCDVFWTERIWVPVGYTWKDLESTPELRKADVKDLKYTPLFVLLILACRYFFERYIATPWCLYLGIKGNTQVTEKSGGNLQNKNGVKQRETVTRPVRKKEKYCLKKATETCWRLLIYTIMLVFGSFVLWRKDWFLDHSKWMKWHIEKHELTWDMHCYYVLELSFYLSLLISQFFDIKRKDFYQLFVHHITTVILLFCSFVQSTYRFGLVILYLHDLADVWLEAAKIANYAKIQKVCDCLFAVFGIVFYLTRLVYYPLYVAYGYFYYNDYQHGIIHKCMVFLCYILLFLHCYWGWLIGKMAYKLIIVGKVDKDSRSESEGEESD